MSARFSLVLSSTILASVTLLGLGCDGVAEEAPPPVVDPVVALAPKGTYSDEDIAHLLARTQFGARPGELERVKTFQADPDVLVLNPYAEPGEGVAAYVDWMLTYPRNDPNVQLDPVAAQMMAQEIPDPNFPNTAQIARWWQQVMVHTENPFQEQMAMFWHDHFATSSAVLGAAQLHWMLDHINLWRHYGVSNLKDLAYRMSTDFTMLRWLDGVSSRVGAPNENFAREFFELFLLGVDNGYTQQDIVEASRAFTGYRLRTDPITGKSFIEFDPSRHDPTNKVIFGATVTGRTGPEGAREYRDMVDLTFDSRPVAEFLVTKLWEHFVYLEPPQSIVDALAALLRDNDYELTPVLRRVFLSKEFYSAEAKVGLIKSPVEYAIGFIRSTGLELQSNVLDYRLRVIGQRPSQPPNVNGWSVGELWLTSQAMIERTNLINQCIVQRPYQESLGINPATLLKAEDKFSPEATVASLAALLDIELSAFDRQRYVTYLNTDRNSAGTVFSDPFDGSDPLQVDKKVRGLLYILAQHPSYYIR